MEEIIQEDVYNRDEPLPTRSEEDQEEMMLQIMSKLEIESAFTCDKLMNLHVLLMHLLAWDNDLQGMGTFDSSSEASFEKALTFDLLCGILESELKEVDEVIDILEAQIVDTSYKLSSCKNNTNHIVKLSESAESLKQSRGQVSDITLQLAQLRRTFHYIRNGNEEEEESSTENSQDLRRRYALKPSDLRHKNALRMLEKSLSRELELEKKLMEFQGNEEQLKLKLHYTEEVSSRMEEASEFIWGRFLESDNYSEVLTGISKELIGRLQILQFSQNGSVKRETELKTKIEDCVVENVAKEEIIISLREQVKSYEKKLKNIEVELKNVNVSKKEVLVHLAEMENANESVKESLFEAESRAESGENKIQELTSANIELSEEVNFLKDGDDKKTKKVNLLEKQVRDLEFQLQNSKVTSEASQEQQNMLYSAIWDMETLIEDLKSKASKAESRVETVEEQCIVISTTNSELNKEVNLLKERNKSLEGLLNIGKYEKEKHAQEITARSGVLMDMVMQLSSERERIQEQLYSLVKENERLRVNQCSRNGHYAREKESPFHGEGFSRTEALLIQRNDG